MKNLSLFLKITSGFILIPIGVFTIINFQKLPETIPIHYGFGGVPNGFGSRNTIWVSLGIATALFLLLLYMSKNPNSPFLNIPGNIKENPALTELVVSILMLIIMLMFADINYESILNALGKTKGISSAANYLLGLLFLFVVLMMICSWRIKNRKDLK